MKATLYIMSVFVTLFFLYSCKEKTAQVEEPSYIKFKKATSRDSLKPILAHNDKVSQDNPVVTDERDVFNHTYAHVVYFWFKDATNENDKLLFEKSLRAFLNSSKYAKTEFIGTPPPAIREVVDDSFSYNLILSFESAAAQKAYQEEAAHKKFIDECAHLWEKVVVYDASTIRE